MTPSNHYFARFNLKQYRTNCRTAKAQSITKHKTINATQLCIHFRIMARMKLSLYQLKRDISSAIFPLDGRPYQGTTRSSTIPIQWKNSWTCHRQCLYQKLPTFHIKDNQIIFTVNRKSLRIIKFEASGPQWRTMVQETCFRTLAPILVDDGTWTEVDRCTDRHATTITRLILWKSNFCFNYHEMSHAFIANFTWCYYACGFVCSVSLKVLECGFWIMMCE